MGPRVISKAIWTPPLTKVNRQLRQETLALACSIVTLRLFVDDLYCLEWIGKCLHKILTHLPLINRIEFKDATHCRHQNIYVLHRQCGIMSTFRLEQAINEGNGGDCDIHFGLDNDALAVLPELATLNETGIDGSEGIKKLLRLIEKVLVPRD